MRIDETLYLIPLLPLLGAAILGLIGSRIDKSLVTVIALSSVAGAFLITANAAWVVAKGGVPLVNHLWDWIAVGRYTVGLTFGFDHLTAVMMLVVTGVGFLIHVYSVGYMHDDPAYWRYFAYLNLFIFAMSVLVLGRSLPVMFIGWEGVGLASYLLIGFWYSDEEKASAGKKAFIVNRVGDFGFILGMAALFGLFGTADFSELERAAGAVGPGGLGATLRVGVFSGLTAGGVITFACLTLFLGATGKSAQLPLYVWLPDAMAGPTPVSALIHAATMVTAGVYMIVRLHFLFDLSPVAGSVVATTGALTAVFAATIGLAQNDIKKVLAYSTVSQLGYMFIAAGVGAYTIAIFHLVTHAFFKACLFLGSGAVIHALHGEQDMRRMGGLGKKIPIVAWTFGISMFAIAGVLPLSGFFSKDAILAHAAAHSTLLVGLGAFGAMLTAIYMSRAFALTFAGELRTHDHHAAGHIHVPGRSMHWPLIILAGLAVMGGALNLPHIIAHPWLESWLAPSAGKTELELSVGKEVALMAGSTLIAVGGLALGYSLYRRGPSATLERLVQSGPAALIYRLLANKWYADEIYEMAIVRPLRMVGRLAAVVIDPWVIDGILTKLVPSVFVQGTGRLLRKPQSGNVQAYASIFVAAAAVISIWALW